MGRNWKSVVEFGRRSRVRETDGLGIPPRFQADAVTVPSTNMDTQNLPPTLALTWTQAAVLAFVAVALLVLARAVWGSPLGPARRPVLWVLRGLILAVLVAILANPVRVDRLPGRVERSDVVYLLDTSASMALGESTSRFAQAVQMVRDVDRLVPAEKQPDLSVYRFGQRLAAIDSPALEHLASIAPTDADTQLLSALRQLTGRFVGAQPHSVVLFSDGRCREPDGVQEMARRYAELRVPIHVVPLGQSDRSGDVAVVNMVAPARVRKHSQVGATVWVRSYGYDGLRTELRLEAVGRADEPARPLSRLPITLTGGIQAFNLNFQSDLETTRVRAAVPLQADEVSPKNNAVAADIAVDRTKIRVLYVEGSTQGFSQRSRPDGTTEIVGPHSTLHTALSEDPDIECVPVLALPGLGRLLRHRRRHRQHAGLSRNPRPAVRLRCDHPERRGSKPLCRRAAGADRRVDPRARRRTVHGRRTPQFRRWRLVRFRRRRDAAAGLSGGGKELDIRRPAHHAAGHGSDPAPDLEHRLGRPAKRDHPNVRARFHHVPSRFVRQADGPSARHRQAQRRERRSACARARGRSLWQGTHDGRGRQRQPSMVAGVRFAVGRERQSLLRQTLAKRRLLAHGKLVFGTPPPGRRQRQDIVPARGHDQAGGPCV